MRHNILTTLCLLASIATAAVLRPRASTQVFRSLSFNIRYAASPSTHELPWSTRGPLVIAQLKNATSAATSTASIPLIGLQEVLHQQLLDIKSGLGASWAHLGTGRDDGKQAGEYVPLLYQPSVLKARVERAEMAFADAGRAVFLARHGIEAIVVANTHLDNASRTALVEGMKVALQTVMDVQKSVGIDTPVILNGDYNSAPGSGDAYGTTVSDGLVSDLCALAGAEQRFGPEGTFSGFEPGKEQNSRIDFIWLGPNATQTWEVQRYEVLNNVVDGVYMSDHRSYTGGY